MVGAITAFHVIDHRLVPDRLHPITHPIAGLAAVGLGRVAGLSWAELGLERASMGKGLRVGARHSLGALAIVGVGPLLPHVAPMLDDPRLDEVVEGSLARAALVDIPLGTALYEELVFRGLLLGLLARRFGRVGGAAAGAALFGLWHVLPAIEDRKHNPAAARRHPVTTVGPTVLGTAAAGAWFSWLRELSGSVLAPILVHAATNSGALASATLVSRFHRRTHSSSEGFGVA